MNKQEEIERIDLSIELNHMLLEGDPELTRATVDIEFVRGKIDSLLDSRFLLTHI